jgi:carboxymethylenebutenolidase
MSGRHHIHSSNAIGPFDAFVADSATEGPLALLLLPEMFGLSPAMCDAADLFAHEGYATAVPNLFWRAAHPRTLDYEGHDRQLAWERLQTLDFDAVVADVEDAARWLCRRSGARAVVALGHCIGGRLAMLSLAAPSIVGAISLYGLGISTQGAALAQLHKPAQLHYGLADEHVPREEIEAVAAHSRENAMITIYRYDGAGHSFCNPNRPMYDASAAALVQARALAFLAERAADLKGGSRR